MRFPPSSLILLPWLGTSHRLDGHADTKGNEVEGMGRSNQQATRRADEKKILWREIFPTWVPSRAKNLVSNVHQH